MQQMLELNQQELERQLFEAEASWSEKLEKKADEFLEEACDYLKRSAECFFWGNFTEEVTLLGVGCQIAVGFTGVDLPFDVRDIIADIINLAEAEEWDWGLVGILLLDLCALLPVIGCLKYVDEAAVLVKHADEAADLVKHADKLKYVDEAGELLTEGRKLADSGIKGLEDAVAEARKLEKELAGSKLLDDVVGDGTDAIKSGSTTVIYGSDDIANYQYNMIENPGPLAEMPNQPAKNFYGGRYNMEVLQEDRIMYRAGNAQNPYGRWFTSEPPASAANVRIDTAVKTHWIDPKTGAYEASSYIDNVYAIKVPKGTTIYTGPVGTQGGVHVGGYNVMQTYIDAPWTFEVVGKTPLQ